MKLTRYNGHVPLFSQDMQGRERTLFGSTAQDDDINNQFTPEFLRGWGSVGSTEFPTLQDFNALAYTHNKLLSYLYQAGIPSYTQNEEYYIGSIVQYNKDIYICLRDKPTVLPTDTNAWKRVQESLTFIGYGPEVMKKGAFGLGGINQIISVGNIFDISETGFYRQQESSVYPTSSNNNMILHGYHLDRMSGILQSPVSNKAWLFNSFTKTFNEIYSTNNTRTDKNNVLHAGTSTPINTLNVSDMSQEVIDNDLLTVTSGAVYRALFGLGQRDSILSPPEYTNLFYKYHDTTDKTVEGTFGVQVSTTADAFGQIGFRDYNLGELRYRHKVGEQYMSGRVLTEQFNQQIGTGQSWVEVTNERQLQVTYVNNTAKPIVVCVNGDRSAIVAKVDNIFVSRGGAYSNVVSFTVPPGSSYYIERDTTQGSLSTWSELR